MRNTAKIQTGAVVVIIKERLAPKTWGVPVHSWDEELVGLVLKRNKFGSIFVRLFNTEQRRALKGQMKSYNRWSSESDRNNGILKLELTDVSFVV